ncbi:MAG: hypothetical protein ABIP90_03685 [Vicinamibacterales bacterium]
MAKRIVLVVLALIFCLPLVHCATEKWQTKPTVDFNGAEWKAREALIVRARVFVESPPEIPKLDLSRTPNDPDPIDPAVVVECHYIRKPITATTAKFHCRLPDGDVIKVKYGWTPERSGEVAATRLLAALGFGADHVSMLPRLRCVGCPLYPFEMLRVAQAFYASWLMDFMAASYRDFTWAAAERKMGGREIKVEPHEGWDWRELPRVDPAQGGATRAELDALRLIAIFMNHWDNKATNNRLVCEKSDAGDDPKARCDRPFLMLQDVGATFGPGKVKYEKWAGTPIWTDPGQCLVSLEAMPYHGGNFTPIRISEGGRRLLAGKLVQFSEHQIRSLFEGAHFPPATGDGTGEVNGWVRTFQDKVRQITDQICPANPT